MGVFGQYDSEEHCLRVQKAEGKPPLVAKQVCDAIGKKVEEFKKDASFQYLANIEVYGAAGERKAKIFLINDEINANKWGVTRKAMEKGVKTIIGKPLIGPPSKGHEATLTVGNFISAEFDGDTAFGIAKISKEEHFRKIESGEWKFVSPEVAATCDIREGGQGESILPCFSFRHVAFVENPAYGNEAQVVKSFIGTKTFMAGLESILVNKEVKTDILNRSHMTECDKIKLELENKTREFKAELLKRSDEIKELKTSIKSAETKSEKVIKSAETKIPEAVTNTIKELTDKLAVRDLADLNVLRAEVVELRGTINTVSDAEKEVINKYSADTLKAIKETLESTKKILDTRPPTTGPKVPLYGAGKDSKPTFNTMSAMLGLNNEVYR